MFILFRRLRFFGPGHLGDGLHQTGDSLNLRGDNDLGSFAVGRRRKGLQALKLQHCVVGTSLLDKPNTVGLCHLHGANRLRLAFRLLELFLPLRFRAQDGRFLLGLGV